VQHWLLHWAYSIHRDTNPALLLINLLCHGTGSLERPLHGLGAWSVLLPTDCELTLSSKSIDISFLIISLSVRIVTRLQTGRPWFDSRKGQGFSLCRRTTQYVFMAWCLVKHRNFLSWCLVKHMISLHGVMAIVMYRIRHVVVLS